MPEKAKGYAWIKFPPEVITAALKVFEGFVTADERKYGVTEAFDATTASYEEWRFDTQDEFFADYRKDVVQAHYTKSTSKTDFDVWFYNDPGDPEATFPHTRVSIRLPERHQVETVFEVFESRKASGAIPHPVIKPKIFIGHGHSQQWRDVRDHLQDKHGLKVEAFETGPRAGRLNADVIDELVRSSTFAILVHTPEDEQEDGAMRARQNVIHETGLFQGRLGHMRAIVLREDGCESFSNVEGLQELHYSKGKVQETFGELVATIRREFPQD